jgi:hypothetical protein
MKTLFKIAISIEKKLRKIGWTDQIPGGLADNKSPNDFNPKAVEKGMKVEMEHTDDKEKAKEIAMDHLVESKDYYDFLEDMEYEMEEDG